MRKNDTALLLATIGYGGMLVIAAIAINTTNEEVKGWCALALLVLFPLAPINIKRLWLYSLPANQYKEKENAE